MVNQQRHRLDLVWAVLLATQPHQPLRQVRSIQIYFASIEILILIGSAAAPAFGGFGTGLGFGSTNTATTSAFSFNTAGFGATTSSAPSAFGGFGSSNENEHGKLTKVF